VSGSGQKNNGSTSFDGHRERITKKVKGERGTKGLLGLTLRRRWAYHLSFLQYFLGLKHFGTLYHVYKAQIL
jgi:hypothetical protein